MAHLSTLWEPVAIFPAAASSLFTPSETFHTSATPSLLLLLSLLYKQNRKSPSFEIYLKFIWISFILQCIKAFILYVQQRETISLYLPFIHPGRMVNVCYRLIRSPTCIQRTTMVDIAVAASLIDTGRASVPAREK